MTTAANTACTYRIAVLACYAGRKQIRCAGRVARSSEDGPDSRYNNVSSIVHIVRGKYAGVMDRHLVRRGPPFSRRAQGSVLGIAVP